jgi:serine/threonine protein kinase
MAEPIGTGGFGCVYKPALSCKNNSNTRRAKNSLHNNNLSKSVSKILSKEAAIEELDLARKIQPLDPESEFFLYPVANCEPREENTDGCEASGLEDKTTAKLIYSLDGGKDFNSSKYVPEKMSDFGLLFEGVINLFEGLIRLHDSNYVHCDIKGDNILVKKEAGKYIVRYIDFGISDSVDDIISKSKNGSNPHIGQPHHPIETRLFIKKGKIITVPYLTSEMRALKTPLPEDTLKERQDERNRLFTILTMTVPRSVLIPNWLLFDDSVERGDINDGGAGSVYTSYSPKFIDFATNMSHLKFTQSSFWDPIEKRAETEEGRREILLKLDIYSLASTLYQKWTQLTGHISTGPSQISLNRNVSLPEEALNDHKRFAKEVSLPFFNLLLKMWNLNPFERIAPQDALKEYTEVILPIIKAYDMSSFVRPVFARNIPSKILYDETKGGRRKTRGRAQRRRRTTRRR